MAATRTPAGFYRSLAIGAPEPLRALPVRLERMIHFVPPHVSKITDKLPAIIPRLSETPGGTEWAGPTVGEHTRTVLGEKLGLSDDELDELSGKGII